ncbi:protein OS-9 homolog isoform X2 [Phalaenopsis equestris]|uniref:protein OS-9 homolog isoform X2 n=1 Tax=Phalaenopsis equestris TaxID=78828 RepID=UPI0009E614F2|nr:protein OS-9 homolog isoform X2 [Phalaenopsis equestris]
MVYMIPFFLLWIYIFCSASAEGIFVSASGVAFGRSSREPKYKIVFHSASSPFHPILLQDNKQESLVMTNKEGQSYICFLPIVEETKPLKPTAQPNSTNLILETDGRVKLKTPDELIEGIKEKCIYRHEGWWSYEFCHQKHVRQLHLEDDKPVQEFLMGVFDPVATANFNQNQSDATVLKDPRSKDASQRYHAHVYNNGTLCDLTNQLRETEIRFVCSEPSVVISSIKEISTCKYVVTIQCPMLCKHPMFHQERPIWHTIHCNEDPSDTKATTQKHSEANQIRMIDVESHHYAT